MEWRGYEPAEPFPAPPPRPWYAPNNIPGGWPGYDPVQSFGHPYLSDPLAAYALPISRPPVASHTRHQRHHASRREEHYRDQRRHYASRREERYRDQRSPHAPRGPQIVINNTQREPSRGRRSHGRRSSEEILTDESLDSDVSEASSANSFVFDTSISDVGEQQATNEDEGAIRDESKIPWAWEDVDNAGASGGGAGGDGVEGEPTVTTYAMVEAVKKRGRKDGKPSPYLSSGSTILYSRFVGEAVPQWNFCTAELSVVASADPVRLKTQPLFRWLYVQVSLKSSDTNASRHLQAQLPNLSSFIVSHLSSSAAVILASRMLCFLCTLARCAVPHPRAI